VMYNCANTATTGGPVLYGLVQLTPSFNPFWKIDDFTMLRTAYQYGNGAALKFFSVLGQVYEYHG